MRIWARSTGRRRRSAGRTGAAGRRPRTVLTGTSKVTLDIPRDRAGTFDPQLIARYQRRFPDFDDKIISMYACGMSTRAIRDHLEELYGIEVSPDLVSAVTSAVLEEVAEWQGRPLDACYPLVFLDAIRVKIRDKGFVRNKAVHIALGILPDGTREILGLWIEQSGRDHTAVRGTAVPDNGAKFWLRVMNELKARGVQDILIAVDLWAEGLPRGHQRRLSRHRGADLPSPWSLGPVALAWLDPSRAPFPGLHLLKGPQGRGA